MVVLPEILYHVTTDLVLHCAKPDKPEILSPSGILREGNFNWRALITGHIYDLSRLCFVERAVWGGAEIDLNDFGRASGYIYTPGRAKRLHELVTQFRDIYTSHYDFALKPRSE
jgi:hypothetical protein